MPIAKGTETYNADAPPVKARGVFLTDTELDAALDGPVSDILWDKRGGKALEDILTGLITTEFADTSVRRILSVAPTPANWRVGEGMAEAFLVDHRECSFPWPSGRDLKNPNASPAGTDLVGFQRMGDPSRGHRYAFGEVKTSEQAAWPPGVMDGRHGLKKQLEDLRDSTAVKDSLVKYLGHHAAGADWFSKYQSATQRYLANPADVSLFGVLVRDVVPKPDDLAGRAKELAVNCPSGMSIELRAVYLSQGTISTLSSRAMKRKEGVHVHN